jgi:hypothetical protein
MARGKAVKYNAAGVAQGVFADLVLKSDSRLL